MRALLIFGMVGLVPGVARCQTNEPPMTHSTAPVERDAVKELLKTNLNCLDRIEQRLVDLESKAWQPNVNGAGQEIKIIGTCRVGDAVIRRQVPLYGQFISIPLDFPLGPIPTAPPLAIPEKKQTTPGSLKAIFGRLEELLAEAQPDEREDNPRFRNHLDIWDYLPIQAAVPDRIG